LQMDNDLSFS